MESYSHGYIWTLSQTSVKNISLLKKKESLSCCDQNEFTFILQKLIFTCTEM